jgi:hypothetical protein
MKSRNGGQMFMLTAGAGIGLPGNRRGRNDGTIRRRAGAARGNSRHPASPADRVPNGDTLELQQEAIRRQAQFMRVYKRVLVIGAVLIIGAVLVNCAIFVNWAATANMVLPEPGRISN